MDQKIKEVIENYFDLNSIAQNVMKQNVNQINESFKKNEITLEIIVVNLGSYLTSTKLEDRLKGLQFLCNFIELQTKEKLTAFEVDYLCEFLINRLKDHHTFIPLVIKSLLFLIKSFQVSGSQAQTIFSVINKEVSVPQLKVSERFIIYQIIGHLLNSNLESFKAINFDFLIGFLQIIEGERDPRCLLLSFSLFRLIAQNFNLGHLDEEMFDTISCYFPIMYRSMGEKDYHISRDDLHALLKYCFMSNLCFAPFLLSLILEKLQSEIETSKVDCYDVLIETSIYEASKFQNFLSPLWSCIRSDCLKTKSNKVSIVAVAALKSILKSIEKDESIAKDFILNIVTDIEPAIYNKSLQLFDSAIDILKAISSSSCFYQKLIIDLVLPKMIKKLSNSPSIDQTITIKGLISLFQSFQKLNLNEDYFLSLNPLLKLLLDFLNSDHEELKYLSIQCLDSLFLINFQFSNDEQQAIKQNISTLLFSHQHNNKEMQKASRSLLKNFSKKYPVITKKLIDFELFNFIEYLTPKLEDLKPDHIDYIQDSFLALKQIQLNESDLKKCINSTIHLLNLHKNNITKFLNIIVQSLIDMINSSDSEIFSQNFITPYFEHILKDPHSNKLEFNTCYLKIVETIITRSKVLNKEMFENISNFLNLITFKCDCLNLSKGPRFCETNLLFVHCILCNVSLSDDQQINILLNQLLTLFQTSNQEMVKLSLEMIESVLNKSNRITDEQILRIEDLIESNLTHLKEKPKWILLLIAVNKSLVIRGCDKSAKFTCKLLHLMKNEEDSSIVEMISKNFVPCHKNSKHLSFKSNAKIFSFYQQKYYHQTSINLYQAYSNQAYPTWRQKCFALCLLHHLKNLPETVTKNEVRKFQSLILTNLKDQELKDNQYIALECVKFLFEKNFFAIQNDLMSVTDSLLQLAKTKSNLQIRRKSLEAIAMLASLNENVTLPLREKVVNNLRLSIDDPKRLVRISACSAIHKWIMISQPS